MLLQSSAVFDGAYLPSSEAAETEALAASSVLMQSTSPDMAAACKGVNPAALSLSALTTSTLDAVWCSLHDFGLL